MSDNCCKSCTKRTANCHCACPDYKEFCKKNDERKRIIAEARQKQGVMNAYVAQECRKHHREAKK